MLAFNFTQWKVDPSVIENAPIAIFKIVEAGDETSECRRLDLDSSRRSLTLQKADGPKYGRPESQFFNRI